jgi:hypothetical protein
MHVKKRKGMITQTCLYSKEDFKFSKIDEFHYNMQTTMENKQYLLANSIDFHWIKMVCDLNPDIYEKSMLEVKNDSEAVLKILLKNLFEDLGLSQKYSHFHIRKTISKNQIEFSADMVQHSSIPEEFPPDVELMSMKRFVCTCSILTPHKVFFDFDVHFDENTYIPPFVEKVIGIILNKIFTRVKQFINKMA